MQFDRLVPKATMAFALLSCVRRLVDHKLRDIATSSSTVEVTIEDNGDPG
jgi:hypothetical protein